MFSILLSAELKYALPMNIDLPALITQGENQSLEFKSAQVHANSLAKELVAFANTSGGVILLGVEDDGSVSGLPDDKNYEEWVSNIARNNVIPALEVIIEQRSVDTLAVLYIEVPKGAEKPYQTQQNQFLVRIGSTNRTATQGELMRMFQQSGMFHFDQVAVSGTTINDLNLAALDQYFAAYELEFSKETEADRRQLLINTDVLTQEGETTVGGLLMFGVNPGRYLPQASIMFAHFNGTEPSAELFDRQEIIGTLPQQVDTAVAIMKNHLVRPSTIEGTKRVDTVALPPDRVLRELVVNACVHRNYGISGSRIRLFIYDDRIECISPGRLPNSVTVKKLRSGVSYASNPVLLKFMDNLRYIDRLGRGFPMIYREMEKLGKTVEVVEFGEELRVIISL
jgi:ATP-dependent DNA helicase RecG